MKILYVGNIGVEGTAPNIRAINNAKLFKKMGHEITFISPYVPTNKRYNGDEFSFFYADRYISEGVFGILKKVFNAIFNFPLINLVNEIIHQDKPDIIILYAYTAHINLMHICRMNNIKLIVERNDWFEKEEIAGSFFRKEFYNWMYNISIKNLDFKSDGIISISDYFYSYYIKRHKNVIKLPPIFHNNWDVFSRDYSNDIVSLVYAGSLGNNKDFIEPIIKALLSINKRNIKIKLNLVGVNEKDLYQKFGIIDYMSFGITCYGILSHDETLKIVASSDFGVLLRNNKRYAKAGFSTKFAECMSLGVPMICTKVGGADNYIIDGHDGFLIENNDDLCITNVLNRIMTLEKSDVNCMQHNAYEKAKNMFNPDVYVSQFTKFFDNMR